MVYSPEKSPKPEETPRIEVVHPVGEKKRTPEEIEEAKEIIKDYKKK